MIDRKCRTVRVSDDEDRRLGAEAAPQIAHGEPHGGLHVLHLEREQPRGCGAVSREPQRDHVQSARGEILRQRVQAVRGIREPMQQQHRRGRRCGRVLPCAVPVVRPGRGIALAAPEVAVEWQPVLGLRLCVHLAIELGEQTSLERAIVRDRAHLVGARDREFLVEVCAMPGLQLGPAAQEADVEHDAHQQHADERPAERTSDRQYRATQHGGSDEPGEGEDPEHREHERELGERAEDQSHPGREPGARGLLHLAVRQHLAGDGADERPEDQAR